MDPETQHFTTDKPVAKNEKPRQYPAKNYKLERNKIFIISSIIMGVALFGFFIYLLVYFIIQQTKDSGTPAVQDTILQTPAEARSYFADMKQKNLLLLSAESKSDYFLLRFESTVPSARLPINIVNTLNLNQDNWMAYLLYTDEVHQSIPYLGNSIAVSNSDVRLNPNSLVPLCALVTFKTKVPGKIKVTIKGRDADSSDLVHLFSETETSFNIPVLGLYENFNNSVVITFTDPNGNTRASKTLYIQTGAPVSSLYNMEVKLNNKSSNVFVIVDGFVYDRQGYIRWYVNYAITTGARPNLVFPLSGGLTAYAMFPDYKTVHIVNMMGEQINTYNMPTPVEHEVVEKVPGGNLLMDGYVTYEDLIVEVDPKTGAILKSWDLNQYFDNTRHQRNSSLDPYNSIDWLHINAIVYDPKDNTLLISSRNQCFFAKIGYDDGKVKFIAGIHDDWKAPYTDYLLTPTNFNTEKSKDQDWTFFQHKPILLSNGNIMIFDNGGARPGYTNQPTDTERIALTGTPYMPWYNPRPPPGYVRAVEYSIDYKAKTISKVWEYTDFPTLTTTIVGSVATVGSDYLLIGYGELGAVTLIHKPSKTKIFHGQIKNIFYRSYPFDLYDAY